MCNICKMDVIFWILNKQTLKTCIISSSKSGTEIICVRTWTEHWEKHIELATWMMFSLFNMGSMKRVFLLILALLLTSVKIWIHLAASKQNYILLGRGKWLTYPPPSYLNFTSIFITLFSCLLSCAVKQSDLTQSDCFFSYFFVCSIVY